MKVRIVRQWKHYKPGRMLDVQPGVAEILIKRKIAELVYEADERECASFAPAAETATLPVPKRKRGRPRKVRVDG